MTEETALAEFGDFEFIVGNRADYPDIIFDGAVEELILVDAGETSGSLFFSDANTVAVVAGSVTGSVVSGGDGFVAMLIAPDGSIVAGSAGDRIGIFGGNTHLVLNAGTIAVESVFGGGQDFVANFGLITGGVRMGDGDDFFINDSLDIGFLLDDGPVPLDTPDVLLGEVQGIVQMGSGDDTVLNGGIMGRVFLGDGKDFYAAITPQSLEDNFNNPLVYAQEIRAGRDNDTVFGGANDDRIFGQQGSDVLNGHGGDDFIFGGNQKDAIRGGQGEDTLSGGNGSDNLRGGNQNDTLDGGNGQDVLFGGRGDDYLIGGSGADTFLMRPNSSDMNVGNDTIADIGAGDVIELYPGFSRIVDGVQVPLLSDQELLDAIVYYDDGTAFLDLHQFYLEKGVTLKALKNSSITFENVSAGDISADNFLTYSDFDAL